jgi:hypothetical protein
MHVDGAVEAPVFTLPQVFLLSNARPEPLLRLNIYILINGQIDPNFQTVPDSNIDIAGRTVSSMVKAQTRSVIFGTYDFARKYGQGFNLTFLDEAGPPDCGIGFDTACMRRLYEYGYEKARSGRFWQTRPPSPSARVAQR